MKYYSSLSAGSEEIYKATAHIEKCSSFAIGIN
jgi:hypothetical protein